MTRAATPGRRAAAMAWGWPLFAFLLALTILKGIRMPSRWAVTHYLFTYQIGFIKRGLWGEILRRVFRSSTSNYFVLATVGLVVFATFLWLLIVLCRRVPAVPDRVPLLLVLLASPGLAYFAHLAGYLEQLSYVMLLGIVIAARRRSWRLVLTLSIVAAVVLPCVHEASVLWVGALVLLAVLVARGGRDRRPAARLMAVGLVAVVWVLSTGAVLTLGRVSQGKADRLRDDRLQHFEFRLRTDAFQTLTTTFDASLREMRGRWADPNIQIDMALSLAVFAPGAIYLGVLAGRRARSLDSNLWIQRAALTLVVLAILGPLLLNIIGRDEHRWNALAALNAGLAALTLAAVAGDGRTKDAGLSRRPARATGVALILCLWGVSSDPAFFDLYGPNHPPFSYGILFLRDAIRTPDRNIWLPAPGR